MSAKYAIEFKVRKIGNGFLLNGALVAENGGVQHLEELFYRTLPELDNGISEVLASAETIAPAIKAQPLSVFSGLPSIRWFDPFSGSRDEDDD